MSTLNQVPSSLLPPFGSLHASHLPTPQSPNTIISYTGDAAESPSAASVTKHDLSRPTRPEQHHIPQSSSISHTANFMTPESSPQMTRARILITPPLVLPRDSFFTPGKTTSVVKSEPPSPSLASSSSQIPAQTTAPHSRLSSPFTERLSLGDLTPTKSRTPRRGITQSASPPPQHPIHLHDVFSQSPSTEAPLLAAPLPKRARDDDTERIRLLLADRELVRIQEAESRRPEYLVRAQRTIDSGEKDQINGLDSILAHPATPVEVGPLGIAETPSRGRRLKLFQETSEESFEESLMVNGYGYGGSNLLAKDGAIHQLSQHTLEWLQQRSPGVVLSPSLNQTMQGQQAPQTLSTKEVKKKKRLAAFKKSSHRQVQPPQLVPIEVEGRGRLLLNVDEHDILCDSSELETRSSRRGGNRRKNKGNANVKSSSSKKTVDITDHDLETNRPNWLDSEFPWCLKANERAEMIKEEEDERMMWVEKFLDRDTDEDESEEEEIMPSALWGEVHENPPMPSRKGRGKMVPIPSKPERKGHMFFPSDPADARAALLSKRAVRVLAYRRAKQKEDVEDSGSENADEVCVCGGKSDSRSLVQCDDCERWYHLRCVGIKNVDELGGDDDPWFCPDCLQTARKAETPEPDLPSSEPIIVPTDVDRASSPPKDPLFFDGSLEQSPMPNWTSSSPPKTPVRGRNLLDQFSVAGSSSSAITAKGGPYTPRDMSSARGTRVYTTPGFLSELDGESNFDPTSTPSRGIKIGTTFVTPKNSSAWSNNRPWTGGLFQTPLRNNSIATSSRSHWMDESSNASLSSPLPRSSNHDTPIRGKDGARITNLTMSSRRLFESPLVFGGGYGGRNAGGGGSNYQSVMLDDSPVVRSAGKKRLRDELDLGDDMHE